MTCQQPRKAGRGTPTRRWLILILILPLLLGSQDALPADKGDTPAPSTAAAPAATSAPPSSPRPGTNNFSILSIEGRVEIKEDPAKDWVQAQVGGTLATGHRLRTGARSRALVGLSPLDVVRVGESMEYEVRPPSVPGGKPAFQVRAGRAYFFGRERPRELQLKTKSVSGAILGTEFEIATDPDGGTTVTMIDGEVELSLAGGEKVKVRGGETITIASDGSHRTNAVLDAVNVIQWTLYYPAVLVPEELGFTDGERAALADSLQAYASGDLKSALALYPANRQPGSPAERIYLGGLLLGVGLVDACEQELGIAEKDSDPRLIRLAGAVRQLISAVKGRSTNPGPEPELASEWIARSYVAQSRSELDRALSAAREAAHRAPKFGFALARLAELEFSFGLTTKAKEDIEAALAVSPRNAQALALRGFLLSAKNRVAEAMTAFDKAIEADSALGNGWLGRGLCRIRCGQLAEGRADLEVAAALEPNRSLTRSYLGKAFAQEGDGLHAERDLRLARTFDPRDPTSPLYLALLFQQQNRINEALNLLETSSDLVGNRSVYRSAVLLDQDRAVRGANLANLYRDAGMEDFGTREASKAVNEDYSNYAAHLFLANSYNALRDPGQVNLRYETPWLSEYLLANLLSPVAAGTLSQTVSQQEYSRFFDRDGFGLVSSTDYRSRGDWVEAAAQYGNFGTFGYAIDMVYRRENGSRINNDQLQRTESVQIKQELSPQDTAYIQALFYNATGGDLTQYYNQADAKPGLRSHETQTPLLLAGYRHTWAPGSQTLFLAGRFDDYLTVTNANQEVLLVDRAGTDSIAAVPSPGLPTAPMDYRSRLEIYTAEAQQIWQWEGKGLILGGRFQGGSFNTSSELGNSSPVFLADSSATSLVAFAASPIGTKSVTDLQRASGYALASYDVLPRLQLNGGLTYDWLRAPINFRAPPVSTGEVDTDRISPKAGVTWNLGPRSTARFAYTRSLGGVSFDQSVRLEPSQVAGFNQAFRSLVPESAAGPVSGARIETFGGAFEHKFPTRTYVGLDAELLYSEAERSIGVIEYMFPGSYSPSSTAQALEYRERSLGISLNQLLGEEWSVGARYRISEATLDSRYPEIPDTVSGSLHQERDLATLQQAGIFAVFNHRSGLFARVEGWRYAQDLGQGPGSGDDFYQCNAYVGYRFARRHAQVQVGLLNIGDQDYKLSPLNLHLELPRDRTFAASLQISL